MGETVRARGLEWDGRSFSILKRIVMGETKAPSADDGVVRLSVSSSGS